MFETNPFAKRLLKSKSESHSFIRSFNDSKRNSSIYTLYNPIPSKIKRTKNELENSTLLYTSTQFLTTHAGSSSVKRIIKRSNSHRRRQNLATARVGYVMAGMGLALGIPYLYFERNNPDGRFMAVAGLSAAGLSSMILIKHPEASYNEGKAARVLSGYAAGGILWTGLATIVSRVLSRGLRST